MCLKGNPKLACPRLTLLQTKHEHWSSPQVAIIRLVSTAEPDVTEMGLHLLCYCTPIHSFGSPVFNFYFCTAVSLFALEITNKQKVISISRQTFCFFCPGKSHLVVLWKSGLCCLSLSPVIDLSPSLTVVVTEPVIMRLFKLLAQP